MKHFYHTPFSTYVVSAFPLEMLVLVFGTGEEFSPFVVGLLEDDVGSAGKPGGAPKINCIEKV